MLRRTFLTLILSGTVTAYARGYVDPVGFHRHKCPKDGFIWSHKPGGDHHCPLCNITQYVQYQGNEPPSSLPKKSTPPKKSTTPTPPKKGWDH